MGVRVSIITPVRIESEATLGWLAECIKSVKAQTIEDWEMVLVNDHSPISWRPLADLFGDPRLRGMRARKEGVSEARNQAASEAKGELLLPLDADDRLRPNSIERFLHGWENGGSEKGLVYSDVYMFGQDFSRLYRPPEYDFGTLLRTTFLLVGCLHRKSDWEKVGGWDSRLDNGLEDWEYWIKFGEQGICGHHVGEVLYEYRRHAIGRLAQIRNSPDAWQLALQRMRDLHKDTYNGKWPKMCCGGTRRSRPRLKRIIHSSLDGTPLQDPVHVRYMGGRKGSFGMAGKPSNRHYRVPGPRTPFAIERMDLHYLQQFNFGRDFQEVQD